MYKILIVDDEELVRKAILQKIDWASLGFASVEEAEDGELALELARKLHPDIVLTDVRMPFMDGLELARHLAEEFPEMLVVILSGHDEFEYVQEAMRSRVYEYLLKPISAAGLHEALVRLTARLDATRKEAEQLNLFREQLRQSLPILRERFFHRLLSRPIGKEELLRASQYLDLKADADAFLCCIFQIDQPVYSIFGESPEDRELLDFSAFNIITDLVGELGIVINDMENRPVVILLGDDEGNNQLIHNRSILFEMIRQNLSHALQNSWSVGVGRTVHHFTDLALSYQAATEVLAYRLVYGCNRIFDSRDFSQPHAESTFYYPSDTIQELLSRLKLEDEKIVRQSCAAFFHDLQKQPGLTAENIRIVINDLVNGACRTALEILGQDAYSAKELFSIQQKTTFASTLMEIEPLITDFLSEICNRIRHQHAGRNSSLIVKAWNYISQHFTDEDLGLNEVAENVSVSPCYLSILFKRETNETFIEHLTRVRMEKAQELLRSSDLKTYEVASRVGYSDPHYFSSCFKKYSGLTPTQFKGKTT